MKSKNTRREMIKKITASALLFNYSQGMAKIASAYQGNQIKHSACKWCYPDLELDELCQQGKKIGLASVELLGPSDWAVVQKNGLNCAVGIILTNGFNITNCFNRKENHDQLTEMYKQAIPKAAEANIPHLICFSGNRDGMDDETGLENCKIGLQKIMPLAEKYQVNIIMELLNSKVNHKDYMCDHTSWGVELCKTVNSERFGLLYDIYHMQIMEGDVIRTIRENHPYIFHYHTGGVPGRNEIDESQELYYPSIIKAIAETGYQGYVGQEFIPLNENKMESLARAIEICTV
ncbi:MAG: hydroxypyruvate isomerase family protein [Candidatus Cyclobacteriaceae bacterium M3_2C_046]